jgi:hypothetical protein
MLIQINDFCHDRDALIVGMLHCNVQPMIGYYCA